MKKFYYLVIAVACFMLLIPNSAVAKQKQMSKQKNILFIMADDMGIDSMRLYTDQLDDGIITDAERAQVPPTPVLDKLASEGVTFNNAWANPACSPTRGTLITGRYGFRTGITYVVGRFTEPGGEGELDVYDEELLPQLLKKKGYATALIGKWHLTQNLLDEAGNLIYNANDDPIDAGFDYWAGLLAGALFAPGVVPPPPGSPPGYYNWQQIINGTLVGSTNFATTENVDQAIGFIDTVPKGKPWFVSLNFAAPHFPYQLPPDYLVNDGSPAGISVYEKVVEELGEYSPPGVAEDTFQRRAIFNAMVYAMDKEIGRLLKHVDKKNTCIIFIGDNGTQGEGPGVPGSFLSRFNSVVAPFDPHKAKVTLYEGGVRVPMVVYCPWIKKPGRFTNALVNTVDIYATILKWAGCPNPNRFDGKQFNAVLKAPHKRVSIRNYIFAEQSWQDLDGLMPPNIMPAVEGYAIRNDRFKLIKKYVSIDQTEFEFYDLLEDPFEENDLLLGELTRKEKGHFKWLKYKLEDLLSSEL